ncbi:MAG TPA: hypothetical protein VGS12_02395 [Caulobacteraceae bacterium]|nr:hypothetical protein [Caulobacteraceae bacterium]
MSQDWASPRLYPLRADPAGERVEILELDEPDYADASFLDERLLERFAPGRTVAWSDLEAAAAGLNGESDYIFHAGHVGSTLLSRILGRSPEVFSVREPAMLRPLASDPAARLRLPTLIRLFARTWRPSQKSLVKATSFVSELAFDILERSPSSKAILMFAAPQAFVAGLLAGPATRAELPSVTPARLARLARRIGAPAESATGAGEMAAAGWTAEICALAGIAAAFPDRCLWIDVDDLLADPAAGLRRALTFLDREASADELLAGGDLARYAKAPQYAFGPAERRRVLSSALVEDRAEIERGLAWINRAANAHPAVAAAANAAAAGRRSP